MNRWDGYGELYHHGILGQKWGVRRYQNEDGTLTDEGKIRYGKNLSSKEKGSDKEFRYNTNYRRDTYKQVSKEVTEAIKYDPDRKRKEGQGIAIKALGNVAGGLGAVGLTVLTGMPIAGIGAGMVSQMITNTIGDNKILEGRNEAAKSLGYDNLKSMSETIYNKKAKKAGMPSEEQYRQDYVNKYGTDMYMDNFRNAKKYGKTLVDFYLL